MDEDYLRIMFENYFRLAKKVVCNEEVIDERRVTFAINGALSGVDYHGTLCDDVLNCLIKDLPLFAKVAETIRENAQNSNEAHSLMGEEVAEEVSWVDLNGLFKKFPTLPKSVKNVKWRKEHSFPCHPNGGKISYNVKEVENWMMANK